MDIVNLRLLKERERERNLAQHHRREHDDRHHDVRAEEHHEREVPQDVERVEDLVLDHHGKGDDDDGDEQMAAGEIDGYAPSPRARRDRRARAVDPPGRGG